MAMTEQVYQLSLMNPRDVLDHGKRQNLTRAQQ